MMPIAARLSRLVLMLAVVAVVLLGLARGMAPAGAQPPADQLAALQAEVAAGRLDERVLVALRDQGTADAILLLDDRPVQAQAAQRRVARGLAEDDDPILAEKANAYGQLKQQALAGAAGGADVLADYEQFGTQYLRLRTAAALLGLLRRPQVVAVRANAAHAPTLTQSLALINQPRAREAGATGAGRAIAVLDTGVDYTRTAFGCTAVNAPAG